MNFSIIVSNNERSYEYLKLLIEKNRIPNYVIHLDYNYNIFKKKIIKLIKGKKILYKYFKTNNIDNKKIENFLISLKEKIIIYSGYAGRIIKTKSILKKKIFLHSHSGRLPDFKGSTTIYYSLLKNKKIFCTTFILNHLLDKGKILLIKKYSVLKNKKKIDSYDNKIRAKNILTTLNNFDKLIKTKKKYKDNFSPYYIIHPILRYIALNK